MIHIFTITARNYLSLAITLGNSVSLHHPEARFSIFVADGLDGIDIEHIPHNLVDVPKLLGKPLADDLAFKYNITEFCTSVKPAIFQHLFNTEADVELVYYLDPDTCLYNRLDVITATTPDKTLYLAPHLIDCRIEDNHPYPEHKHLWEGIFNLGFCAIRRTNAAEQILHWWNERLMTHCYADFFDGLHTDQKWMDYAPVFFRRDLEIVTNYGVNVAHWNLAERTITEADGQLFANNDSLVLFHFSGFDFKGRLLSKHTAEELQEHYLEGVLLRLANDYRERVMENGYAKFIKIPYAYAFFDNKKPVTSLHRRLYRVISRDRPMPSPFSSAQPFYLKLKSVGLLDESKGALGNYSAATVPNLGRIVSIVEWLLGGFRRLFGVSRYVQLIKFFSRYSRYESHAFLVKGRD